MSAILSAVLRPMLVTVPLHGINAPSPATGKTLLAKLVGIIATGRDVAAMPMGTTAEEFEKRIDAALLAADPVALIDNVSRPLGGDAACINLTSSRVRVRVLGTSDQVEMPATTFWMATGNNLIARGDMVRRMLICTLDAGVERPELRSFKRNITTWTAQNRIRLLSAVYTILRAYALAGSPASGLPPLGSFEDWSRRVRDALVWAGAVDPVSTMNALRDDDPEMQTRVRVFETWHALFADGARNIREITHLSKRVEDPQATTVANEQALIEELSTIGQRRGFDAQALGYWLRGNRGRIAGGLRLDAETDTHAKSKRWRVRRVAGDAGDCGDV